MQYKVISIYCNCLADNVTADDTSKMEQALNELSQEGWKPLHITPSPVTKYDIGGDVIQIGTNLIITLVK